MSDRKFSLAIKPAGSSLPVLIRKPVLKRVSDCSKAALDRPSVLRATNELTFVLILVIAKHPCQVRASSTLAGIVGSLRAPA
jgi:hypothetical protein